MPSASSNGNFLCFGATRPCPTPSCAGEQLFLSHELYKLKAYVAESSDGSSTASYYGIAVVKADKCGSDNGFTGFNRESLQVM